MNPSFFVFFRIFFFLQQIWDNERKYHSLGGVKTKKCLEAHFVFRKFRYYTFTWRFGRYANSVLSGFPIPLFSSCSFFLTLGCNFATKTPQPIPSTKNTCPLSIHLATMGHISSWRKWHPVTDFFPPLDSRWRRGVSPSRTITLVVWGGVILPHPW